MSLQLTVKQGGGSAFQPVGEDEIMNTEQQRLIGHSFICQHTASAVTSLPGQVQNVVALHCCVYFSSSDFYIININRVIRKDVSIIYPGGCFSP